MLSARLIATPHFLTSSDLLNEVAAGWSAANAGSGCIGPCRAGVRKVATARQAAATS